MMANAAASSPPSDGIIDESALAELRSILTSQKQRRRRRNGDDDGAAAAAEEKKRQQEEALDAVRRSLAKFGVVPPPPEGHAGGPLPVWRRTVPSSLFSVPAVPSRTTLVALGSLPRHVRERYAPADDHHDDDEDGTVVEVPVDALLPTEEASPGGDSGRAQRQQSLASRPIGGNLSGKLSEYTRGRVGAARPFRPGGMDVDVDVDGGGGVDAELDALLGGDAAAAAAPSHPPFRSPEEGRRAREALELGGLEAWRRGLLITAPPGATFRAGLTPEEVYEDYSPPSPPVVTDDEKADAAAAATEEEDIGDEAGDGGGEGGKGATQTRWTAAAQMGRGMWDGAFEDDSLFGSSSSSSSSESSGESESESEGKGEDEESVASSASSASSGGTEDEAAGADASEGGDADGTGAGMEALAAASPEDVDALLDELTMTAAAPSAALPKANLPRDLLPPANDGGGGGGGAAGARQQRKSWAVTASLDTSDFHALVPNPAIKFPFELDDFQKQAVARLERGECVFVAAHTSAGKTVCAEYAIALCEKHCTRAVYTSPIKALSNQKYRDFKTRFDSVGLITGDLQVNPSATCLIMTTEILRSMLYRGADIVRDIEWVIFDEVHYINDTERGVVWEEVIIMLPDYVNLIFLSATTPNTIEFSDWIGRTKRKPVHVIRTNYRPVPLSHHLYAGHKLHKILEGKSAYMERGYNEAARALLPASSDASKGSSDTGGRSKQQQTKSTSYKHTTGSKQASWQQQGNKQDWTSLVKFLEREELVPAVIFCFSKKKCEENANMLKSMDLNTAAERNAAHSFASQTMKRLSPSDSNLPQVITTCEMVERGIGVHHGGLLPILKEMVEILFSRNLIKILFATETFAMGVNMPARCVVFNSIRKHDGTQFRVLQPGEYIQMSGRAGRRGLDKVGTVLICCFGDEPPPQLILKNMLTGSSTKLQSQFRLTYNMILNLLRVEDMSVEDMIKRSFSEFATQRALTSNNFPKLLARGLKTLAKLDAHFEQESSLRIGAEDIEQYYAKSAELLALNDQIQSHILSSAGGSGGGALVTGRVILVTSSRKNGMIHSPAVVLKPPMLSTNKVSGVGETSVSPTKGFSGMICLVLLPEGFVFEEGGSTSTKLSNRSSHPGYVNYIGTAQGRPYAIKEIALNEILIVTSIKLNIDSKSVLKEPSSSGFGDLSAGRTASSVKDPFSHAKPKQNRSDEGNPFAGLVARGKGGVSGSNRSERKGMSESSQYDRAVDQIVACLVEAEKKESTSDLDILDLRTCTHGVQKGDDAIEFRSACDKMEGLFVELRDFNSHSHPNLVSHYSVVERKETLRARVESLRHVLSNEALQLFPDFLQRKAVLRTLGYVDKNDTVCVKGRVACEVNTCESLIVTEMVFEGILNDLEPAEVVAALSALLFQEKSDDVGVDSELPDRLISCCESMKTIALNLGYLQKDHRIMLDPKEYCEESLKFGLVHVVYEWALGVPFSNICELTLVQEGSIVRCITRLDELCREVRNCARVVGNPTLYRRMEDASVAIKRDIVFASSLYVN